MDEEFRIDYVLRDGTRHSITTERQYLDAALMEMKWDDDVEDFWVFKRFSSPWQDVSTSALYRLYQLDEDE